MPTTYQIVDALTILSQAMAEMDLGEDSASLRLNDDGHLYFSIGMEKHVRYDYLDFADRVQSLKRIPGSITKEEYESFGGGIG